MEDKYTLIAALVAFVTLIITNIRAQSKAYKKGEEAARSKAEASIYRENAIKEKNAKYKAEIETRRANETVRKFHTKLVQLDPGYDPNELYYESIDAKLRGRVSNPDPTPIRESKSIQDD